VRSGGAASSVPDMLPDTAKPQLDGLGLLLAESDREDPYLTQPLREDAPRDDESLDEQILAGLVTP
jgi:hypothetical protein